MEIGVVDRRCQVKELLTSKSNGITKKVLYTFARHVYLSFIHIPQPLSTLFSLKVKVKKKDALDELSEDSNKLLSSHFDTFLQFQKSEGCAVAQVAAFTREILIEFHSDQNGFTLPSIEFFTVPEPGNTQGRAWYGKGCPDAPFIPHSRRIINSKSATYTCEPGYLMVDPTMSQSQFGALTIECRNNFEWDHYPFPVCRKLNSTDRQIQPASGEGSRNVDTYTDSWADQNRINIAFTHTKEVEDIVEPNDAQDEDYMQKPPPRFEDDNISTNDPSSLSVTESSDSNPVAQDENGNVWSVIAISGLAMAGIIVFLGIFIFLLRQYSKIQHEKNPKLETGTLNGYPAFNSDQSSVDSSGYLKPSSISASCGTGKSASGMSTTSCNRVIPSFVSVTDVYDDYVSPLNRPVSLLYDEADTDSSNFYFEIDENVSLDSSKLLSSQKRR